MQFKPFEAGIEVNGATVYSIVAGVVELCSSIVIWSAIPAANGGAWPAAWFIVPVVGLYNPSRNNEVRFNVFCRLTCGLPVNVPNDVKPFAVN